MTAAPAPAQSQPASRRLLADIGGTYARFAIEAERGRFEHVASVRCADHVDFHAAVSVYLARLPADAAGLLAHAAVAIADPVEAELVRVTACHWQFSIEQMRQRLGLQTLVVVNDFTALAMALPRLTLAQRRQVGGGSAVAGSVLGVLGAGTGLGVTGLIPAADGWVALGAEGGHASFSPRDEREIAVLRFALKRYPHVSFERLLSGPGLELIDAALRELAGLPPGSQGRGLSALEITRRALQHSDPVCVQALDTFCAVLGTAAANLALTLGALAGVYVGGAIVPRLGAYFDRSPFRTRFEDKGRFSDYLRAIPTYVVTAEHATLMGVSAILAAQLHSLQADDASAILGQVRRSRETLSPAEKRVAEHVLAHPRSALSDPIAEIARAAAVSQPTVIRFCRSLGCEGLSDFKLRLASGLSGTVPVMHTPVTGEDGMLELGVKVLGNTASAILQVREQLHRDSLARAVELLAQAQRIEFYAVGDCSVVADDAQFKFLRLGVPSAAVTDTRLQMLSAKVLRPGDMVVISSSSGREDELLAVADGARERGATVLAITAGHSPLSKRADLALIVDPAEDVATQVPMISRILHLLVIDILAVAVAMRRGVEGASNLPAGTTASLDEALPEALVQAQLAGAQRAGLGISAAGPLARLTSHSR